MANLLSIERFVPPYRYRQAEVVAFVERWLRAGVQREAQAERLLKVYHTAGVVSRGSVVPIEEVFAGHDFERQNDRYREIAHQAAIALARNALDAAGLAPGQVDLIISLSCTGFMIPAVDAYVADALGMGPRLARLPITEAGCAGGVVGLARARDFLLAHPDRAVLLLALEFSSLTFQQWDRSPTNVVSAAIFGDGGAALVLVGDRHPAASRPGVRLRVRSCESRFFPGTTHMMGFRLRNTGLQILLDRGLSAFVRREVGQAVDDFLVSVDASRARIASWILHPGGRRVIEAMAEQLGLSPAQLAATERVLSEHGNMSSVTVLFVLEDVLRCDRPAAGSLGLLGAFGPGFAAELALLEFR